MLLLLKSLISLDFLDAVFLLNEGHHTSGVVLSWVAVDLTVLVLSTQQLMHIIDTNPSDPCGSR